MSLDELKELLEAEETRAALREEWHHGDPGTARAARDARRVACA